MVKTPVMLETERLRLKSVEANDAGAFYNFLMKNYDFFKPWSPEYPPDYKSVEFHLKRIESLEKDEREGRGIKFAVYKKEEDSRIIGSVALSNIVKGPFLSCYLGYRFDENENGKGYAAESVKSVIDYAFENLKLHRVEANIIPQNKASIKVAEKLGFVYEGTSKKYLQINSVWEDHMHYVILNEKIE